jgi:hypothetical protein
MTAFGTAVLNPSFWTVCSLTLSTLGTIFQQVARTLQISSPGTVSQTCDVSHSQDISLGPEVPEITHHGAGRPFCLPGLTLIHANDIQICSVLASNTDIRNLMLALSTFKIDDDSESGSKSRVPFRHLEDLTLKGEPHHVFPIPHQLALSERVDRMRLEFYCRTSNEVREVIVLHIQNYLHRHDPRFEDRPGIFIEVSGDPTLLRASVIGVGYDGPDRLPQQGPRIRFS